MAGWSLPRTRSILVYTKSLIFNFIDFGNLCLGGPTGIFTWGTGGKVDLMDMANLSMMLEAANMWDSLSKVKNLGLERNITKTTLLSWENFK